MMMMLEWMEYDRNPGVKEMEAWQIWQEIIPQGVIHFGLLFTKWHNWRNYQMAQLAQLLNGTTGAS